MTLCCSPATLTRAAIAHGFDPGRGGRPSQDTLPGKGSNGNGTVTDPSSDACGYLLRKYDGSATTFNLRGLDGALLREVEPEAGASECVKDDIFRDGLLLASQHRSEGHQYYHSFTGHQRDLGSPTNTTDDLEYMHARYYGVKMGRLLSVDAGGPDAGLPGSWNRYSYAYDSSTELADPDGDAPTGVLTLPLAAGGTSAAAVCGALLATGAYGSSAAVMIYFVVAHAEPLGPAQVEQIQAVYRHPSPAAARRKREKAAKPVSSHPPADASGETTTPPPPPADQGGSDTGGRRTTRKANPDRQEKARKMLDELEERLKNAKTNAERRELRRFLKLWRSKLAESEEHARVYQHS